MSEIRSTILDRTERHARHHGGTGRLYRLRHCTAPRASGLITAARIIRMTVSRSRWCRPGTHRATRRATARSSMAGMPAGIVLKIDGHTILHMGDTTIFSDMALINEIYKPDIGIVPIGGHYTMDAKVAATGGQPLSSISRLCAALPLSHLPAAGAVGGRIRRGGEKGRGADPGADGDGGGIGLSHVVIASARPSTGSG